MSFRVLDLCCGLGGATSAFREAGHEVVGVELNPEILEVAKRSGDWYALIEKDVRRLDGAELEEEYGPFDFVWASPPCTTFSVMTISVYHDGDGYPDHPLTHERIALVHDVLALIYRLDPPAWVLENPTGMLGRQDFMGKYEMKQVTYCQYGHFLRKSTDLWGGHPPTWEPRKTCSPGDSCHESAPAGSAGGVQNQGDAWDAIRDGFDQHDLRGAWMREGNKLPNDVSMSSLRSLVPRGLSQSLLDALEAWEFDREVSWRDYDKRQQTRQLRVSEFAGRR